jgi:hypothetical protein
MDENLGWVALAILVVNLPFGFWRSGLRKFSPAWFVAIHAPVPFVAAIRILAGVGWQAATFPVLIGAYFAGQFLGSVLGRRAGR